MGNIEIRQQNTQSRRKSIFSDRKSFTPTKRIIQQSSSIQNQNLRLYSPIRYSNTNQSNAPNALTQRKTNTQRLNSEKYQNQLTFSQVNFSKTSYAKREPVSYFKNIKLQKKKSKDEDYVDIDVDTLNLSGKIVPNTKRTNYETYHKDSKDKYKNKQNFSIQNPLQNRQIIKKVRNFNDFLNEIKRKLKQDKFQTFQRKKSSSINLKNSQFQKIKLKKYPLNANEGEESRLNTKNFQEKGSFQKTKSIRKIQVALKLENQRLQLQKYRKLVQRQLSKTHSIQNISLCTRNSGQKVLTIQYESLLGQKEDDNNKITKVDSLVDDSSHKSLIMNLIEQSNAKLLEKNRNISSKKSQEVKYKGQKSMLQQNKQKQLLKKLREEYESTMKNMLELGNFLDEYEKSINKHSNVNMTLKQKKPQIDFRLNQNKKSSKIEQKLQDQVKNVNTNAFIQSKPQEKISKIQNLFQKLNCIQQQCQQTDRQIREAIEQSKYQTLDPSSSSILQYDNRLQSYDLED